MTEQPAYILKIVGLDNLAIPIFTTSQEGTTLALTAKQALDLYAALASNHRSIFAQYAVDLREAQRANEGLPAENEQAGQP